MEAHSEGLDAQIQTILAQGGDLHTALSLLRKRDLGLAESATRERMLRLRRCPVCTLAPPCKHFGDATGLPRESQEHASSGDDVTRKSPRMDAVRFRSVNGSTVKKCPREHAGALSKSLRKRARLLERLDKFKEEQLRRKIEQLESAQEADAARIAEEQRREHQRRLRHQQIKTILSTRASAPQPFPQKSPRTQRKSPARLRELIAERVGKALESSLARITKVGE